MIGEVNYAYRRKNKNNLSITLIYVKSNNWQNLVQYDDRHIPSIDTLTNFV